MEMKQNTYDTKQERTYLLKEQRMTATRKKQDEEKRHDGIGTEKRRK